jgi:hypothetical protein
MNEKDVRHFKVLGAIFVIIIGISLFLFALNGRYEILFNGSGYFDKWTNTVCKSQFKD